MVDFLIVMLVFGGGVGGVDASSQVPKSRKFGASEVDRNKKKQVIYQWE